MKEWVKLLRLKHWIKNLLVLFPLFFSGEALDPQALARSGGALLVFCLASSFVYILNDAHDVDEDKLHPRKRYRPLAIGTIPVRTATVVAMSLLLLALLGCVILADNVLYSLSAILAYIVLNIAYSLGVKTKPIADVTILALGFLLRVVFGGVFCDISISSWLFLTVLSMSFFLALGKRLGELTTHGIAARKSLALYSAGFLEKNMYMFLGLGLVFYSLWTFQRIGSFDASIDLSTVAYIAGILLAILMCLRYNYNLENNNTDGDPTEMLLGDSTLIILFLCWIISMGISVYWGVSL